MQRSHRAARGRTRRPRHHPRLEERHAHAGRSVPAGGPSDVAGRIRGRQADVLNRRRREKPVARWPVGSLRVSRSTPDGCRRVGNNGTHSGASRSTRNPQTRLRLHDIGIGDRIAARAHRAEQSDRNRLRVHGLCEGDQSPAVRSAGPARPRCDCICSTPCGVNGTTFLRGPRWRCRT